MSARQRPFRLQAMALLALGCLFRWSTPALADAFFKPVHDVQVTVTYEGEPVSGRFKAVLLERRKDRWVKAKYMWGGDGKDGFVDFFGFFPPDAIDPYSGLPPAQVRLEVRLPSEDRVFLTDVAGTRPNLTLLKADLRPDGTGSLTLSWISFWQRLDWVMALGLTLVVELTIVALYGRYRQIPLKRLLIICALVNIVSLPVVWSVTYESYRQLSLGGWKGFIIAEIGATLFEGLAYAWPGRLGFRSGLLLSVIANTTSMLLGLIL